MKYVPLHVQSEYSLLDGLSQTKHIANRLGEIETEACAITDHGTVSGAVDFHKTISNGFKPILGCKLYVSQEDSTFSGHIDSVLGRLALNNTNWKEDVTKEAERMEEAFGKGNFYIEVKLIDSLDNPDAKEVAEKLREVSKITGIPCVATPEARYCKREDADDQRVLLCTALRKSIGQVQKDLKQGKSLAVKPFFSSDNYHIPTYEEMSEFHTSEELANTIEISNMCSDYSILSPPSPPEFPCPVDVSPNELLRKLCREGWLNKMGHIDKHGPDFPEYGKRVDKEISIFTEAGLSSYFLIVQDILRYAKEKGYLIGPGRGSAAGCIVSHLIGITQIDPVPYRLIFERFYNAGRNSKGNVSMPDIDIDVPKHSRTDIIEYIQKKYGNDNVAQIITFQTLKGRASLKRVMAARGNISFDEQNAITSHILDEAKIADELQDMRDELGTASVITWALENKQDKLKDWCELDSKGDMQGKLSKIFEQAIRLEGTKIIQSKHAAGVVISPLPIYDVCPMIIDKEGKGRLAGFEGTSCEDVGLLKLDILGIKMLDKVMDISEILKGERV